MNRPLLRNILLSMLLAAAGGVAAAPEPADGRVALVDRIVAVVNSEVITRVELDRESRSAQAQLRRQGTPLPDREILDRQLLERLITKTILQQYALQTGVRVPDPDLERAIERIASENKLSPLSLRQAVEDSGQSFERFREELRGEMVITRLREREVDSKVTVSEAEIQTFLRAQATQEEVVDEYFLLHILVTVPEQATPAEVKARRDRAEEALSQLKGGADFGQVAASFSDAPDALQGGALGWRAAARLPGIFLEAVKALKIGELSDVLRSPAGFHVLRLKDKRGNNTPIIVTQTRARHILIRLTELVSENDARQRLGELRYRSENGVDFAELARLQSDDASAARGGDLGWVSPGDTVPEFERAMDALKPGQVSAPFKSPFGWHIVQVLERREQDMSKDRQRLTARQAIISRKADEQWQEWVRQQRDKAYVEYHLEEK
jgi:peptidyl-prolyl cis-trans isomerase SurA